MKKSILSTVVFLFASWLYAQQETTVPPPVNDGTGKSYPKPIEFSFENWVPKRGAILPASYDMRQETGRLTAPRAQGSTNTCWGFATMDALQSVWTGMGFLPAENYSVENLVNCTGYDITKSSGGARDMATAYLARFAGPVPESVDPYQGVTVSPCKPVTKADKVAVVSQIQYLPKDKTAIKQMLLQYGGVFTAVSTACFNTTVYYNSLTNAAFLPSTVSNAANHAGTIVGWDDNYAVTNFNSANRPQNPGAWIVKNTYGTGSNEQGYYYLSYEDKIAGEQATVFNGRIEKSAIDTIYYYDKLGMTTKPTLNIDSCFVLQKYTAPTGQQITGIGTFATAAGAYIDISIYRQKINNTLYGLLAESKGNYCEFPGYYTFPLKADIQGDFYIEIKYKTPNINTPFPMEKTVTYASPEILPVGSQWIRPARNYPWSDVGSNATNTTLQGDLCIKVLAKNLPTPSNDDIANALPLTLGSLQGAFYNGGATKETNEPAPPATGCTTQTGWCEGEDIIENSLWFTFVAPSSGSVSITTTGFDNQIAVYDAIATGTYNDIISGNPANYIIVAANDDASETQPAATISSLSNLTPGKTYWLQMDGSFHGSTGNAYITITDNNPTDIPVKESAYKIINPSKNGLLIIQNDGGVQEVEMFDMSGKKVSQTTHGRQNEISISVSALPAGYYLVKIKTPTGTISEKVNIVH